MLAFFRSSLTIGAVLGAGAMIASSANALQAPKPVSETPSSVAKVRHDRDGHRHYHRRHRKNVVRAPFTRVESGRRTVVDAPFVHVYEGRRGKRIVAPFVDIHR